MRTPRLSPLISAVLLAGSLALACSSPDESPAQPQCALGQLGDACGAPGECCSGNCQNQICVSPAGECGGIGAACGHPYDCCQGACNSVSCVDPNACSDVGVLCDDPTDCCTGVCGGTVGSKTCREPDTLCAPLGDACAATSDCCDNNTCDGTTSKCTVPTDPTCKETGSCINDSDCCSTACGATGCAPSGKVCAYGGQACSTASDCCSQNCPNAGTPGATCSSVACRQATESCVDDSQCCSLLCGFGGVCDALPPGSTGATCKTLGEACTLATDCCSTNCQSGTCKPSASCNASGDICVRTEDCCSGICAQSAAGQPGRCEDASGGCGLDGYPCSADSNCCTKQCADLGTGAKVCKMSGGCRMTGNYCDSTASCCGGTNPTDPSQMNEYGVFCDGPGGEHPGAPEWDTRSQDDRTCTGGQSCNPPGNICGYKASQNCCYAGGGSGKAVCKPDAGGIMRCFGGPVNTTCPTGYDANDPQCCIPSGDVCQFRDQCCGFAPCVPDASGVLRCSAADTCMPQGAICSVGAAPTVDPCCEGTTCREIPELGWACSSAPGACAQQGQACGGANPVCCFGACVSGTCGADCAPNGSTCSTAAQCCSGLCDGGVCASACVAQTGTCTVTGDCCAGLTCDIPAGSTSGTCTGGVVPPTCAETAQSCLTLPCCNTADTCDAGVCTPPPVCSENGQLCTSGGGECCNPLGCYTVDSFEQRQPCTSGSVNCFCDTVTECVQMDAACSTLVTCCGGYCAQNGGTATCTSTDPAQCTCKPVG